MIKFSKKVEYALISLIYMAEQESDALISSRELAKQFNFPQELIGKVLQSLAKCNYLQSVQGVHGGYQLAEDPEQIKLASIVYAVDGPIQVVKCLKHSENCGCEQLDHCNIRNPMEMLQLKLLEALSAITLKDLKENNISFSKPVTSLANDTTATINVNFN